MCIYKHIGRYVINDCDNALIALLKKKENVVNVVICDRQLEDVEKYNVLLHNICKKLDVDIKVLTYTDAARLLFELEDISSQIDLVYLENNFSDYESGKEVARKIRKAGCKAEIIFLTNRIDKWPDGYDVGAFHYLLKSDSSDRFNEVFRWVNKKIHHKEKKVMSFVYAGDKIVVELTDIQYFESQGRIITLHYGNNRTFDFYSRMAKLENSLLPEGFIRIHRSYLVNRTALEEYKNGVVKLRIGHSLPVSRNMYAVVKNLIVK